MATGFVIALLLCSGDNCDLVRLDPGVGYATYDECREASQRDTARIGDLARRHREAGREGDVVCLRDITPEAPAAKVASAPPPPAPERQAASPPPQPAPPVQKEAAVAPRPPALPPAPTPKGEFRDCQQCPVMLPLPPGSFVMGSNNDPTERPPHRVTLGPFAIGRYELTEAEWAACASAGGCRYKPGGAASPDRPMTNLSWDDAVQYVHWLAAATGKPYRLPSEAEWEYAARASTTTNYPWGDAVGVAKANCKGCGGPYQPDRPAQVNAFPPNQWGIDAMLGGVAEWTEDCWHPSYAGAPANGSAWPAPHCARHVLRGGSWMNPPSDITVSSRNFYDTSVRYIANGLRVALSLK